MQTSYVVEVNNLSVSYYVKKVLNNISFSVPPRQLIGIIGPNGAGKSTLVKAILGLINIDQGNIKVLDQPVSMVRKHIAYVPQRNNIDMDFPVLVEDVAMMGRYPYVTWWGRPGKKDQEIVHHCLNQVGMYELRKRQIGQLSGGQQQRVFLARALAQEASLFFWDEPFSGIDMASENIIMELFQELRNKNKTLFVVHHDLNKARSYFDNLLLINKKLIAFGSGDDVFQFNRLREAYEDSIAFLPGQKDLMVVNG